MKPSTEKTLQRVIYAGIFAVPFLAFFISTSLFFPFITGKNFAFRIIVEIIFAAWVLLAYYKNEYRPKRSWVMTAAASFVGIIFVADLFGANLLRSFWSNSERMEGFVGLIHTFAFFVVAGSVLTRELWKKYFQTFLVTSVFMAFYGLLQLSGNIPIDQGSTRLDGTFGNAAYLGIYMLFNVFLAVYFILKEKKGSVMNWVYGFIALLDAIVMYYTATRGVLLGFLGGVAVAAALTALFERERPVIRKYVIGTLAGLLVLVGLFFAFKNAPFIQKSEVLSRFSTISLNDKGTQARFMVWGMAIDGFKERPVLGWGQDNFNIVFNQYYNPGMYDQEQWFDRAHDIFLDWLIAGGIFGLLGYLLLFVSGIALVWKIGDKLFDGVLEKSILTGLFAAYFINNIFVFDNLFSYILFFSVLAYLHSLYTASKVAEKVKEEKIDLVYTGSAVVVALIFTLYVVNMKPIFASMDLISAMRPGPSGFSQQNVEQLQGVFDAGTFVSPEAREQVIQIANRARSAEADSKLKQSIFDLARTQALIQISENPNDARAELFAGMLFYNYGMISDAAAHFERAHELSPKKQAIYSDIVLAYINMGKMDKALAAAKESFELDKENPEAVKAYSIAALAAGDQALSDKILTENFGTTLVYDDNLVNSYAMLKRYDRVVAILEKANTENPGNVDLQVRLAAAYAAGGDKARGIRAIQDIIKAHPDFSAQGQYYISLIEQGKVQ